MGAKSNTVLSSSSAHPCAELRAVYHDCFNRWYSDKFSKGKWDKEECVVEWDKYRACLAEHLKDKHLRRLLVEAEASKSANQDDSAGAEGSSRA